MQLNMWNFNTLLLNNGFLHDHPINQIVQICHRIKKINLLCGQSPTKWRTFMRWNPLAYSESTFKNENGFGSMWFIDVLLDLEIGHQYLLVEALIYTLLQWYQGKKIIENVLQMTLINFNWFLWLASEDFMFHTLTISKLFSKLTVITFNKYALKS